VVFCLVVFLFGIGSCEEYYISNDGDDGNSGLSDGDAWASLGKVYSYNRDVGFDEGDDIYLKCDDEWVGQQLIIDWSGSPGDRVFVGAYYGSEKECGNRNKPVVNGNDVVPGFHSGLVHAQGQNYVTVENLRIINSGGHGVRFPYDSDYCIARNVDCERMQNSGIQWASGSDHGLAENCTVKLAGLRSYDVKVSGYYSSGASYDEGDYVKYVIGERTHFFKCVRDTAYAPDDSDYGFDGAVDEHWIKVSRDWPFGIGGSTDCNHITVRNCSVLDSQSEGIGFFKGSNYGLAEYNTVGCTWSAGIYVANAHSAIVRYNLIYGTGDSRFWRTSSSAGSGLNVADEGNHEELAGNVSFYGNLVAYRSSGIFLGVRERTHDDIHVYDNIFVGNNHGVWTVNNHGADWTNSEVRDNIIWTAGGGEIYGEESRTPGLEWGNNMWSEEPDAPAYNSQSDDIRVPDLRKKTGWRELTNGNVFRSDFDLMDGSVDLEVCGNGLDDDLDGLTDCDDSDCFGDSGCEEEPEIPVEGCVGMSLLLHFDGDARDSSGSGNDGEVVGARFVSGEFGEALEFDGADDYVSLRSIDFGGSFTISAWVRPDVGSGSEQVYFGAHGASEIGESLHLRIYDDGRVLFGFRGDDLVTGSGVVEFGVWQNVVVSYDAVEDVSRIYVGGVEVASGDEGPFVGVDAEVSIGNWMNAGGIQFFDGVIDEVGVWDRALSVSEVEGLSSGVVSCGCVVVGLGDVSDKILEWKSGVVGIDAVLDVVEAWKSGC